MVAQRKLLWLIGFGLIVSALGSAGLAAPAGDRIDPVVIRGDNLDGLLGESPDAIRVYAYSGGFRPVPFQVDERMEVSAKLNNLSKTRFLSYAFDAGPNAAADPIAEFDADDELVFMAWSAAGKAPAGATPSGARACEEIELSDPAGGGPSYVYACLAEAGPVSTESYVNLISDTEFAGQTYEIGYPENNPFNFDRLQAKGPKGLGPDMVDRLKHQIEVVVIFSLATWKIDEREQTFFLRGIKAGPVRVVKEFESVIETLPFAQIRTYNFVYYYPRHLEYTIHARSAVHMGEHFNDANMILAIDLSDAARGMRFFSQKNPEGQLIDGKTNPSEIDMDYGPTEWVAASGQPGSVISYLGFNQDTELHKDMFYADNDAKGDPLEDQPGMVGKHGFMLRNMEKEGFFERFPVRYAIAVDPAEYQPGMEKEVVDAYARPLTVKTSNHQLYSQAPSADPIEDQRENQPRSTYAEQEQSKQATWSVSPSFGLSDLYGLSLGISYSDVDFLRTGMAIGTGFSFSQRGQASANFTLSQLRFIQGVQAFQAGVTYDSFPSYPFYGVGNDSTLDDQANFWITNQNAQVTFSKIFSNVYGADFRIGYRNVTLDTAMGTDKKTNDENAIPSLAWRFGRDKDLMGKRWGGPLYGMDGGRENGFTISLYRDMHYAKDLPKFGNYEALIVDVVTSALGADYDYARVTLDLRGYWHPDFLNPLPWADEAVNPKRTAPQKFIGPDKQRALAGRVAFVHLIADSVNFYGNDILQVPFYDLTKIGSTSNLRSYASERFAGNDAFYVNLEYRWRAWKFVDVGLFWDSGLVMDDLFDQDGWDQKYHNAFGPSIRVHLPPTIILTAEIAFSEERTALQMAGQVW